MNTLSDLLPSAIQDELLYMREFTRRSSFRIGDIALQIAKSNPTEMVSRIHKAVGLYAGKSERTVREYAAVSAFYPFDVRLQYDVLAFDHFRIAMRYGDEWKEALDWCLCQTDELNRPATVDEMEEEFSSDSDHADPEEPAADLQEEEIDAKLLLMVRRMKDYLLVKNVSLDPGIIREAVANLDKMQKELEFILEAAAVV